MKVYSKGSGWHRVNDNWNQVCNGGIGMGALAVADDEPRLAGEILSNALASLPLAMRAYDFPASCGPPKDFEMPVE